MYFHGSSLDIVLRLLLLLKALNTAYSLSKKGIHLAKDGFTTFYNIVCFRV